MRRLGAETPARFPARWPLALTLAAAAVAATALSVLLLPQQSAGAQPSPEPRLDRAPGAGDDRYVSGEIIVTFDQGRAAARPGALGRASELGAELDEDLTAVDAAVLSFPQVKNREARALRESALERTRVALEASPFIESAEYNFVRETQQAGPYPNDPQLGNQQNLRAINTPGAWSKERGVRGAKIAVADSGIDSDHPDLANKIVGQRDLVYNDNEADESLASGGHGSHVSGIAAAQTNNGKGVAGACPNCGILAAKVIGPFGGGTDADIAKGINWSTNQGAEVINLSLGGPRKSEVLRRSVARAQNNGSLLVAAAGNDGDRTVSYPAAYPGVVGVGAVDNDGNVANFSTRGGFVDLSAPGTGILSTVPPGGDRGYYERYSGTSQAAPAVSGVAGLLASQGLEPYQIRSRLQNTATDRGPAGKDLSYGYGVVDANRAVPGR